MIFLCFLFLFLFLGVKLQLKAESSAHTKTHGELIEAQQELDTLRKAKMQVDEYRTQCAESAIMVRYSVFHFSCRNIVINPLNSRNLV